MSTDDRSALLRQPYVLPADVVIIPVTELADQMRNSIECDDGDFAITRPGYRTISRAIDARTVELLEQFREPTPIADAVVRFATTHDLDPHETLVASFPVLQTFSASLILVPAESPLTETINASLVPGQYFAGYEIRRVVQALQDTETYLAFAPGREPVALKIIRQGAHDGVAQTIEREAAILARVNGACSPRLVETGSVNGRSFLVTEWLASVPITARAHELRVAAQAQWRNQLHRLCCSLLDAYTELHRLAVVHGDINARNVVVDAADRVSLIDFGLGQAVASSPPLVHGERSTLAWFLEPEAAGPLARSEPLPPATFAGEQYSVAALTYYLLSGEHHVDAPLQQVEFLAHVESMPPVPFATRGFESWPQTEAVLGHALAKDPADRFVSMGDFGAAFAAAHPPERSSSRVLDRSRVRSRDLERQVLAKVLDGPAALRDLAPKPPTASAHYGAAGIAWFLYRAAQIRESAEMLIAADLWSRHALASIAHQDAFVSADVGMTPERLAGQSLYNAAPGVHVVHGLISHARGDVAGLVQQVDRFIDATRSTHPVNELMFGRSGHVVGGALLLDVMRTTGRTDESALETFLRETARTIWADVRDLPPVGEASEVPHLGMAHGWAGLLFAQLRSQQVLHDAPGEVLEERLEQLAALAEPDGRGASWPGSVRHGHNDRGTPEHAPGWCAGSAGFVHLWLLAHEVVRAPRLLELARLAAWHTFGDPDAEPLLCCGLGGRIFALLRLHQYTGELEWRDRAETLAEAAVEAVASTTDDDDRPLGLFRGTLGPLLANIELERPELATMSLFSSEGWPRR